MALVEFVGLLPPNQKVYLAQFQPGCLDLVPWGGEQYDCFVLNLSTILTARESRALAVEIARGKNDWIQVLGANCEAIHDAIDQASVDEGRQKVIGDGSPMTSWHDDKTTLEEMVEFALKGSFGASEYLLALVVGSNREYAEALRLMKSKVTSSWQGFH